MRFLKRSVGVKILEASSRVQEAWPTGWMGSCSAFRRFITSYSLHMWRRRGMELHQSLPQEACIERTVLLLLLAVAAAAATHFLFGFLTTMFARDFIRQTAFF